MIGETTHLTLLQRLAGGDDPHAWHDFQSTYGELIRTFARLRGVQAADCDDVLQDVLFSLTKAMPGFRYDPSKGRFRSYLKTAVIHAILRRSRQNAGRPVLETFDEATRLSVSDSEAEELWEAQWRQHHVRRAMKVIRAEFGEKDVEAFNLYGVRQQPAEEVGAALTMSVDQVYQAKSRIVKRLTALIQQQVSEEG